MASADFTVDGATCPPEAEVAYGATVNLALLSTAFNTAAWSIIGSDRPSTPTPTITPSGSPLGATASFTMVPDPATGYGAALLVQCKINGGRDAAGQVDATLTKTALIGVPNTAGNVPFVVGETLERSTTHGYTAVLNQAMAATGAQGEAGAGLLLACDALATSNVTQSGTTAVDGVTLVANVTRVLCVGQTSTAQNGIKVAQVGAWTNPTDFASDAQVAAAVGSPIYIKPGGLTGGGTNWQMTAGTSIAGAKTFAQIKGGARDPVRAIQTLTLPAHTVAATTLTATANGALGITYFDSIASYAVGDRLEVNTLGVAHARNGIYVVTQVGTGGTPWILTRAPDLDSAADFVGGVAYDVLDGLTLKGRRRQLYTQGAVVLGTTALAFGEVRPSNFAEIDVTLPEWGAVPSPTMTAMDAAGTTRAGAMGVINRAIYACWKNGGGTVQLPQGWLNCARASDGYREPMLRRSNVAVVGAGCDQTYLASTSLDPGWHCIQAGSTKATLTPGGGPVDPFFGAIGPTALQLKDATNSDAYLNITHSGLRFNKWPKFTCVNYVRAISANTGNVVSTRGRPARSRPLMTNDSQGTTSGGAATATLRVWSNSAMVQSTGASSVLTLTGTAIADDYFVEIVCTKAGGYGVGEFIVSACAGGPGLGPFVMGATVSGFSVRLLPGVVLNWTNVPMVVGDTWRNWETRSVATTGGVTVGVNTILVSRWDGGSNSLVLIAAPSVGSVWPTLAAGPSTGDAAGVFWAVSSAFTLANPTVHQWVTEETVIGSQQNEMMGMTTAVTNTSDVALGSTYYAANTFSITPGGAIPSTIYGFTDLGNAIGCRFTPATSTAEYGPEDVPERYGWRLQVGDGTTTVANALMVDDRLLPCGFGGTALPFASNWGLEGVQFATTSGQGAGILVRLSTQHYLDDIKLVGKFGLTYSYGFLSSGSSFGTRMADMFVAATRICYGWSPGEANLHGKIWAEVNGGVAYLLGLDAAMSASGTLWMNTNGALCAFILGSPASAKAIATQFDDENDHGFSFAGYAIEPGLGAITLAGHDFLGNTEIATFYLGTVSGSHSRYGVVQIDGYHAGAPTARERFYFEDNFGPIVQLGANSIITEAERWSNQAGLVSWYGGAPAAQPLLLETSGVLLTFVAATSRITRATGSFFSDGYFHGDTIEIVGSVSNNITEDVENAGDVNNSFMTLPAATLVNEGPTAAPTIYRSVVRLRHSRYSAGGYRLVLDQDTLTRNTTIAIDFTDVPEGAVVSLQIESQATYTLTLLNGIGGGTLLALAAATPFWGAYELRTDPATLVQTWKRYR